MSSDGFKVFIALLKSYIRIIQRRRRKKIWKAKKKYKKALKNPCKGTKKCLTIFFFDFSIVRHKIFCAHINPKKVSEPSSCPLSQLRNFSKRQHKKKISTFFLLRASIHHHRHLVSLSCFFFLLLHIRKCLKMFHLHDDRSSKKILSMFVCDF